MKILTPGHKYEMDNFEISSNDPQVIQFIEKIKGDGNNLITVNNGTTNEEVLAVLIDRIIYLNNLFPCEENTKAIESLQLALSWLNLRTSNRIKRDVEGKHEK